MLKILLILIFTIVSVTGAVAYLLLIWAPSPNNTRLPGPDLVSKPGSAPSGETHTTLSVMTWNIGFAGGARGEPTDLHSQEEVQNNLKLIERTIAREDPDILLLQEVDRPSKRTAMIDEYQELMEHLSFGYGCFVTTWDCHYVPFPMAVSMEKQLGRIHSGQAVLSKFPIRDCKGLVLPQPQHNSWVENHFAWWKRYMPPVYRALRWTYNRFYLHRTIQVARIDIGLDSPLPVLNCHLEAFDQQNREQQATIVRDTIQAINGPLILGGDFNTLPPDARKKKGFSDEDIDFTTDNTLKTILSVNGLRDTLTGETLQESSTFTFPSYEPTRRLDYIMERGFMLVPPGAGVVHDAEGSDHLPIIAHIVMR